MTSFGTTIHLSTSSEHNIESHPLALDESTSGPGSSKEVDSDATPFTFTSRRDTVRGPSSSSQTRPGYFDLQRLAAAHAEASVAERERNTSISYSASASVTSSSASSSRASENGMEEIDDGGEGEEEEDDDEEIPRWLKNANSTMPSRRPASRSSLFSNMPSRGANRDSISSIPFRGSGVSSRNSMRSPPPSSPLIRKSNGTTFQTSVPLFSAKDVEEEEVAEAIEGNGKPSQQYLTSLHLMTDDELDRQLGVNPGSSSRPNPSPLQSQASSRSGGSNSTASRSVSGGQLKPPASSHVTRSTSSFGNLEGRSANSGGGDDTIQLRVHHKLLRDLSEHLSLALQELDVSRRAFEQERDRLSFVISGNRKESEAKEEALRDILTTMGVSKARVDRALVQAIAQAQVPVFKADERLTDYIARSEHSAAGRAQASGGTEDLLPQSLREAMLEGVNSSPETGRASLESVRRPIARRATHSSSKEEAGNQTPLQSHSPNSSAISVRESVVASTSTTSTPAARSAWGSGLVPWVGTVGGNKKAVASIQATSPAAVEADGYFSDGPGKDPSHHSPSPTPKKRNHRSTSISAIMSQARDESEDEEDKNSWTNTASRGAFGILGTLAWRRKKPDRVKVNKRKQASTTSKSIRDPSSVDEGEASTNRSEADLDSVSIHSSRTGRSSISAQKQIEINVNAEEENEDDNERNEDTIRAKTSHIRPQAQYTLSGRDVITALYEAIGSAPVSPEHERKQAFISTSDFPKPNHFKAICLATRIMTSDPGSLLLDNGKKTSQGIQKMAMVLVEVARAEGKVVSEPSNIKSSRRNSTFLNPTVKEKALIEEKDVGADSSIKLPSPPGQSSTTATLSRALGRYKKPVSKVTEPNVTKLPQLFGFGGTNTALSTPTDVSKQIKSGQDGKEGAEPISESPLVTELEPILAHDVKPPTLAMSVRRSPLIPQSIRRRPRQNTIDSLDKVSEGEESSGDEFEVYGGKNLPVNPLPVDHKSGEGDDALLTDRYGFVYDATPADVRLLRRARREATHAPACLTGIRVGVRARGGTDSQSDEDKDDVDLIGPDSDVEQSPTPAMTDHQVGDRDSDAASQRTVSSHKTAGTVGGAVGSNSVSLLSVKPSKPVAEASTLSAASQLSSSSLGPTNPSQERLHFEGKQTGIQTSVNSATRRPPSTSQTVKRLLGQLQEMHKTQQSTQQTEWDDFLRRRRVGAGGGAGGREKVENASSTIQSRSSTTGGLVDVVRKSGDVLGIKSKTGGGAMTFPKVESASLSEEEWHLGGLVGLSQMGTETKDYQDFCRLIQKGVPLVYRSKIWYECSGALELNEPGKYQELLLDHENQENLCTNQIDLDIGRTMPTNIYFAGDGPGVIKLRRLLVAFSWYNPKCGYCQGMNNLAATLLLTHATEEEAFWVLVSIIEKILPEEYYTSHLLVSQADQRVLMDLMEEVLPQLAAHMRDLGVDLPAVTFAWFLSLYTDCLPVETLFRVWDVMFVEGMIVLFRIALAIFIINEKELLETSSPSAFYSFVHSMTSHLFSVDRLIKLACEDLKSTVRKETIVERREKHVQDLTVELGLDTLPSPA